MVLCAIGLFAATRSDGKFAMPAPILASSPLVSKTKYDQIMTGMNYEQVCEIIGARGQESSRTNLGGFTTVMYQWMNPGGSNMNAMFQNDSLISKAQFGLP